MFDEKDKWTFKTIPMLIAPTLPFFIRQILLIDVFIVFPTHWLKDNDQTLVMLVVDFLIKTTI